MLIINYTLICIHLSLSLSLSIYIYIYGRRGEAREARGQAPAGDRGDHRGRALFGLLLL